MFKKIINLIVVVLAAGLVLAACGEQATREAFPTPAPNPQASQIVAPSPGPVPNAKVTFPEDEAPHNNITEWWYYTGHLTAADGSKYGFEYVIFQGIRANFPPGYVGHLAVTDLNKQVFKFDQRIMASTSKIEFGGKSGFNLALNDWTMQGVGGTDRLKAAMSDNSYGLDITLKDQKGPVLHGGGLFSYGAAGFSYYFSRPRMSVNGSISIDGQTRQIKEGVAWFDHQWGDFVPLSGGWDWFSLHLEDNSEVMVYYLRDDKDNVVDLFGSYSPPCQGNCDLAGGKPARAIDLKRENFVIKSSGQWTSPATGGVYPSGWNIKITAPGAPALELAIKPQIANQELDTRRTTGVIYWEGACEVSGTKDGQPISGQSYVELTGYAKNVKK